MLFIENLSVEEFKIFNDNYPDNHFMQTYEWGEMNKEYRGLIPIIVGMKDDNNNLVAAALLLKRKTPFNMCYIYSPRGYLIDYNNKELLKIWTEEVKKFLIKENAIYLKFDPDIIYQDIDEAANPISGGFNNYQIFNNLIDLGYKHLGFNKLYERNQPRYTFRIDLNTDFENIEKNIHPSCMKTIKRSYNYDLEVIINDDVKTFHELLKLVSAKDNFKEEDLNYYQKQYDLFKKHNNIILQSIKIYPDKELEKVKSEIETFTKKTDPSKVERANKDIEFFGNLKDKYPEGKIIASLISIFTTRGVWTMYIGSDEIAKYTLAVNRLYYETIKYAHEHKYHFLDFFGTVGDPETTYKNLAGIHEYKRKYGGKYIEFIGEFDLIIKPNWYKILPKLLTFVRKIKKLRK